MLVEGFRHAEAGALLPHDLQQAIMGQTLTSDRCQNGPRRGGSAPSAAFALSSSALRSGVQGSLSGTPVLFCRSFRLVPL